MIDAPAGIGRIFTERTIAAHVQHVLKDNKCSVLHPQALPPSYCPRGLTASSTVMPPFGGDAVGGSVCDVKAESDRADVLKRASLISWEKVMSSEFAPEALNLTLRDPLQHVVTCYSPATLFCFGGNWRQVGPVFKFGTETEIVEHAFPFL